MNKCMFLQCVSSFLLDWRKIDANGRFARVVSCSFHWYVSLLNRIQSRMVKAAFVGSDNMLLCAPTGAGKTNVALMAMLNLIGQHRRDDGSIDLESFKIVYVVLMKALVQEVLQHEACTQDTEI